MDEITKESVKDKAVSIISCPHGDWWWEDGEWHAGKIRIINFTCKYHFNTKESNDG